jgi:hypothetical protein
MLNQEKSMNQNSLDELKFKFDANLAQTNETT